MSDRYMKGTVPRVIEYFGEEKGGRIVEKARKYLSDLIAENPDDPKSFQSHSYGQIYPLLAFQRALEEEGMKREEATEWLNDKMMEMCDEMVKPLRRIMKLGLWRVVPKLFNSVTDKLYTPESGFEANYLVKEKDESRFDMVKCPYYETFKRYGYPELCLICCASDDRTYGNLSDRLVWNRTKTLARGGDCCDFNIYYRSKEK